MNRTKRSWVAKSLIAIGALVFIAGLPETAQAQRLLGLDVSAWQSNISTSSWATLKRSTNEQVNGVYGDGRDFVFIRSSRGGTTGYYNQNDADNSDGNNTLSQRYDDPYFVQNITRATAARLFAGPYHFSRPDIVTNTLNSGGIANTGADEADHFIQMAGAWMRPGYLFPVHDLEAGISQRSRNALATFALDFSDRIYEVMGIRPAIYINGAYADYLQGSSSPAAITNAYPVLWSARWPNQSDPNSIPVQTAHPKDSYGPVYGPWDDAPRPTHPWSFWQYASTARLNGNNNKLSNTDVNVLQGGMEFLKDHLVPALWLNNTNGNWTTLTNWNSGKAPVAPVQGPGQVARVGSLTLPPTRLPSSNDIVILNRPNANVTVTLNSGTQNIRKLFVLEALNVTGGSLTVNYVPSDDSTPLSAQFFRPVTLMNAASLSVHTLQVDPTNTFTLGGGTLIANIVHLMPNSSSPAKLVINGNVTISGLNGAIATITNGTGIGVSGNIDLSNANRTITVSGQNDVAFSAPVFNGGLVKSGTGTLRLNRPNGYAGGTTIANGTLLVNNTSGSGTGSGTVTVNGGRLSGTGTILGAMTVNNAGTVSPGTSTSIGNLTLQSSPTFGGTNFMEIIRNGSSTLADKITLTSGTLNYGGTLVVSNAAETLTGGEVFTLFWAPNYSGSFADTDLPPLGTGLNWYLGNLTVNGSIKVNRSPVATLLSLTNTSVLKLEIPISSLLVNASDADADSITLAGINLVTTNGVTLTTNGSFVSYVSSINMPDQFTYTVSDGRGGITTGIVRIAPFNGTAFWRSPTTDTNSITLHLTGAPGSTNYLERSGDLLLWQTISTNVLPSSGIYDFIDQFPAASNSSAYYRLRW